MHLITLLNPLHRLLAPLLTQLERLNLGEDLLIRRQLQHGLHLLVVSQVAGRQLGSVRQEGKRLQGRERLLGDADHVELAVDLEERKIRLHVELVRGVGAVQDEVELELVRLRPLLVVARDDDVLRAQLFGVLRLVLRVSQRVGVGSQGARPLDGQVAEAADADDADRLAGADLGADEWGVSGDARAEKGGGEMGRDGFGDLEGEVLVGADVRGPAAGGVGAIWVLGVVGVFIYC